MGATGIGGVRGIHYVTWALITEEADRKEHLQLLGADSRPWLMDGKKMGTSVLQGFQ